MPRHSRLAAAAPTPLVQTPSSYDRTRVRNFSIIAHIDHGKSTLADRLIQRSGALSDREMRAQILDSMELERERGITIKAQAVRLIYQAQDNQIYQLNFIDTPGHIDFSYEVSRSLAACEGSVLLVDASQGVEAQTLINAYKAVDQGHEILVALNKVDLPAAEPERVRREIEETIGLSAAQALLISAKSGQGVPELLEAIVRELPAPQGDPAARLRALVIDSWYDPFLGVMVLLRVIDGVLTPGMRITFMASKASYQVENIGVFTPKFSPQASLSAGEIGVMTAAIKRITDCRVGDTLGEEKKLPRVPLAGFREIQPVVFCALFSSESTRFHDLRQALEKLVLNDSSLSFEPTSSPALGQGFRCGFLGLLHMEITRERLEREFNLDLIATAPSVIYHLTLTDGSWSNLHNPLDMPEPQRIVDIREPWIRATMMMPAADLGRILALCEERRGLQVSLNTNQGRAQLVYDLPLNEVVFDFYDRLKSLSRGHASYDYELLEHRLGDLVQLRILINTTPADALTMIVHRSRAESRGRALCLKLKELIPRQLFKVALQAAVGGRIVARETVAALRKDVTAKCYGGDVTRKRKLLEKQKAGKKRMQQVGNIEVPKSAFIAALKTSDED